ncbi:MAG: hypothetical protein ABIH78_02325 [Candidatus Peregrinibacteria bacterium]
MKLSLVPSADMDTSRSVESREGSGRGILSSIRSRINSWVVAAALGISAVGSGCASTEAVRRPVPVVVAEGFRYGDLVIQDVLRIRDGEELVIDVRIDGCNLVVLAVRENTGHYRIDRIMNAFGHCSDKSSSEARFF